MARSDERAAVPEPVWVTVYDRHNGVMMELDKVRKQLAAQGLHVVSDADMRVLEAMGNSNRDYLDGGVLHPEDERAVAAAEVARREGKR